MSEKPDEKTVRLVHGIMVRPSQVAQDLLAAFHMGAMTVLSALAPHVAQGLSGQGMVGEQMVPYGGQEDSGEYGDVTLPDLMGMDPLRREAMLAAYGLSVRVSPEREYDPTAGELNQMMEGDGIPTRPGPGGAVAGLRASDDDEEERTE